MVRFTFCDVFDIVVCLTLCGAFVDYVVYLRLCGGFDIMWCVCYYYAVCLT